MFLYIFVHFYLVFFVHFYFITNIWCFATDGSCKSIFSIENALLYNFIHKLKFYLVKLQFSKMFKDLQEILIDLRQELVKAVTYIYDSRLEKFP